MAAPRGSVGTCNVSVSREWDGHGRSVGRSLVPTPRAPPGEKRLRFLVRGWGLGTRLGRSVGRSVDARGPVDHASVGLAQARPNKIDTSWGTPFLPLSPGSYNFCLRLSRWPGNQTCVGTTGATSTKEACWNCTLNST